jgi:hypothetical protein
VYDVFTGTVALKGCSADAVGTHDDRPFAFAVKMEKATDRTYFIVGAHSWCGDESSHTDRVIDQSS